MKINHSLMRLHLKMLGGYLSLIILFAIASWIVLSGICKMEENSHRYTENIERRNLSEQTFLKLFDLTQLDGAVSIWNDSLMQEYEDKERTVLLMIDSLIAQVPDTAQERRVKEIRNLVGEKKGHLLSIRADLEQLRDVNGLMKQRMPELIHRANRANERLTEEVSENLQENRHKTAGWHGLFKSKKKADEVTDTANRKALSRAKSQTDRLMRDLVSDIEISQERSTAQLFAHMDTLIGRNRQLNDQITRLVTDFNNEDAQRREHGSAHLMQYQRDTVRMIAVFGLVAFLMAVFFFWLLHRDLKLREKSKRELEKSNQHNEELLTLRHNMMLTVSHDLRSPLTAIMGYADLLADTTKDEKCRQYEDAIKQSSDRMLTLLNSLLSYYRLDTGKDEVELVPFRVKDIVSGLLTEYEPLAEMKNISIEGTYTGADTVVMGDRKRIVQIASNILSNAVKFTQKGTINIGVEYAANTLTIKVKDSGTGMTEEQMKRIFAPFNRLENADTQEGFGLGLSIAKALANLLGGNITVESHVGFGSLFTVSLPVVEGDEDTLQQTIAKTSNLPEGLRIAVVDDDTVVLKMTVEMLAKKNVQVVGCHSVNDLFDRMRKSDYDLIITDIKLGGLSGFDLLALLRNANIGNSKSVPLLAMTGRTERSADDYISAGFKGCLLKPFSYAELTQAIANSIKEDTTGEETAFKIPRADLTTLLQGEKDVEGMLKLLVEQTESEMAEMKSATETGDEEKLSFLQHKLESRWELLGIVKPMLRLRDALKGKGELDKAVNEVVLTAEQLKSQAKEMMEGGAA